MDRRRYGTIGGGGFGLAGPVPQDLWLLLAIVFITFSLRFFEATAVLPSLLRLAPEVWQRGFAWQVVTYPFVGTGLPGLWFVLELLILFLFGRQVFFQLGRRRFWQLLVGVGAGSGVVAGLTHLLQTVAGFEPDNAFLIMQGQRMLLAILVALFATLNRQATILLFFVLPIQARWFLLLEVVFAFLAFLSTHDLPGLVGICAAVALSVTALRPGSIPSWLRELSRRTRTWWLRLRLAHLRRKRGFTVIPGEAQDEEEPWIH